MIGKNVPDPSANFFNLKQARWLVGVLGMLIGVVGKESLLGLILRQTRAEIASLVRDEEQVELGPRADAHLLN
jgi:hypothetical protein